MKENVKIQSYITETASKAEQINAENDRIRRMNEAKKIATQKLRQTYKNSKYLEAELRGQRMDQSHNMGTLKHQIMSQRTTILEMKEKMTDYFSRKNDYMLREKFLRNKIQELKGNIRVFCRIRPVIPSMDDTEDLSVKNGTEEVVRINGNSVEICSTRDGFNAPGQENNANLSKIFRFDAVFGDQADQNDIFKEVYHLVMSALDGYKIWIFAFGQTGSGKTYTMEGNYEIKQERGIIPRAVEALFSNIEKNEDQGWNYEIVASFQEIYLDQIRDLLSTENWMKQLNKASDYEPTRVTVEKASDVYSLLDTARDNRVVGSTSWNDLSSRSHSLFQLSITASHPKVGGGKWQEGAINLIDLAGSERLHKAGNKVEKNLMDESTAINKSLSWLRDVIRALATKEKHVPYRNSKLTYLLQPHLGSKSAKTLMVVNASPLAKHVSETINSLRFASEVNTCSLTTKKGQNGGKKKN